MKAGGKMLFILVILAGFMASAFVEYILHKLLLHQEGHIHLLEHHKNFKPQESTFTRESFELDEVFSGIKYLLANFLLYLPIGIIIGIYSFNLGLIFLIAGLLYTAWIEIVHYHYHHIDGIKFERFKLFNYLKSNHKVHHALYEFNFGIGSSIWDIILGTSRKG